MSMFYVGPLTKEKELEASHRLRFQVYCLERHFLPAERYPDQLEVDELDACSSPVGVFNVVGDLVGSARIIHANARGFPLFQHCRLFPNAGQLFAHVRHPVEFSRMVVSEGYRRRAGPGRNRLPTSAVLSALIKALFQECRRSGIDGAVFATDLSVVRLLQRFLPVQIIGPSSDYFGTVTPCFLEMTTSFRHLAQHRPALYADFIDGLPPDLQNVEAHRDYYQQLTEKNEAFLPEALQEKIRDTRLLISGCGRGSLMAEAAVRSGFEKICLLDGALVTSENLNRQAFQVGDLGQPKVEALAKRLKDINPHVEVDSRAHHASAANVRELISRADIVFDTIDFLDLEGMVALHDEAHRQGKPVLLGLMAGYGAACLYFPPGGGYSFRQAFGLPAEGEVRDESFVKVYMRLLARLAPHLQPNVLSVMRRSLRAMEDHRVSPTSQMAPGAYTLAGLLVSMLVRVVQGQSLAAAPRVIYFDPGGVLAGGSMDLPGSQKEGERDPCV